MRYNTMKVLILEDCQFRSAKFRDTLSGHLVTIVTTAKEAIDLLNSQSWDWLFLDHDLGGRVMVSSGPGTGYEVACWLEQHPDRVPPHVVIHSFNPAGAERMNAALPQAIQRPGVWDSPSILDL